MGSEGLKKGEEKVGSGRKAYPRRLVPKGRLKEDCLAAHFQPSLPGPTARRDRLGRPFKSNPGLASWAKFSRPCGTKFVNPPRRTWAENDGRPGFPATGRHQYPRVRLSLRKAAWSSPTP